MNINEFLSKDIETEVSGQNQSDQNKLQSTKLTMDEISKLKEQIIITLKDIYDPEIPVNIYELGLIYDLIIDENANIKINMTLTTPMCPVAQTFPQTVQERVLTVPKVASVVVELVWEPTWTQDKMSEAAKLQLNLL